MTELPIDHISLTLWTYVTVSLIYLIYGICRIRGGSSVINVASPLCETIEEHKEFIHRAKNMERALEWSFFIKSSRVEDLSDEFKQKVKELDIFNRMLLATKAYHELDKIKHRVKNAIIISKHYVDNRTVMPEELRMVGLGMVAMTFIMLVCLWWLDVSVSGGDIALFLFCMTGYLVGSMADYLFDIEVYLIVLEEHDNLYTESDRLIRRFSGALSHESGLVNEAMDEINKE